MLKCDHCLLTFPERDAVYADLNGQKHVFCCNGCRGIYTLIHAEGLSDFYKKRKWDDTGIESLLLSKEIDIKPFVEHVRDITENGQVAIGNRQEEKRYKEIDIFIDNIRCASCVWLNERILSRTEGVDYARVNYATHKARIRWDPEIIGLDNILKRIASIGYNPKPYSESEQFKRQHAEARDLLVRFGTAGFLSSQLMIYSVALYAGYFQGIDSNLKLLFEIISLLLTIPVIFYSGMPFLKNTLRGLRNLHFNMDSLITVGAGSAFVFSIYQIATGGKVYFDTAAMIITLILLGRYIETTAKGKASETIERLSGLRPREASIVIDCVQSETGSREIKTLPVSSVQKGNLILVKPGEKIPLDGIVIEGESEVDESIITGESKPILKTSGDEVIGGSLNLYGTLVFEVKKTENETVLSGIIRAVEDAQARKPRIQRLADRIVGYFVPAILVIAFLTVIGYLLSGASAHRALMTGISVLVIACPCSLGLATPLAVLVFTTMTSSKGILIRGGEVIENASRLTHVMFDKTGTITAGKPALKEIVNFDPDTDRDSLLSVAASIESVSEHSIGHAIIEAARGSKLFTVSDFKAVPGRGVKGAVDGKIAVIGSMAFMREEGCSGLPDNDAVQFEEAGDTVVYAAWDKKVRAAFVISDVIREEAIEAVKDIGGMNLNISMISGDNRTTTASIASKAGIGNALSEASPVMKKEAIEEMQRRGYKVMMVGDGINDAPALTESSVGMAMGRGTDIAMESADAVLVRNDLRLIPYFIRISGRAYAVIKQNIFWAFFYNIISIPLAVAGILHPIIAAGAMAASSLLVVVNSLRIKMPIERRTL
ncbi:MAG: cadmium-translocating P-type ATPase [Nitrospirae bacterium]|nr:cadmium-translocating P-type ATPase [Nitrospirota bacterium]